MRIRRDRELPENEIEFIANVSDALAHPMRIKILKYILECNQERNKVCNKDLVAFFDYSQATISQHVKRLIQGGLVQVKKEEKFSYYFVNIGLLGKYVLTLKKLDF